MPADVGPHLLGRLPSPPDPRDFRLARFVPPPPPLLVTRTWRLYRPLIDQGDTGHCVGFGWCQWGNLLPVADRYEAADGHAVYYECKVLDGDPGGEAGSYVRSGAKAMQARGRLAAYAFAATLEEVATFLMANGPVVLGTVWRTEMFTPNPHGFVSVAGADEGGHCWALNSIRPRNGSVDDATFGGLNSWGPGWGRRGRFFLRGGDLRALLAQDGEACASVELTPSRQRP
jgi:hypothetical protein